MPRISKNTFLHSADGENNGLQRESPEQQESVPAVAEMLAITLEDVLKSTACTHQAALAGVVVIEWIEAVLASRVLHDELTKLEPSIITLIQSCSSSGDGRSVVHLSSEGDPLSARERNILHLMGQGMSNKKIARQLSIAPETVKTYAKRIFVKLSVQTRAEAVGRAAALGII
jgi:DNA-binding CsgD family transcriptional regulator